MYYGEQVVWCFNLGEIGELLFSREGVAQTRQGRQDSYEPILDYDTPAFPLRYMPRTSDGVKALEWRPPVSSYS
jgi:hypothetical protein